MDLSILFLNDVHGHMHLHPELFYKGTEESIEPAGGYARLSGYINKIRKEKESVLVFDGGDSFHGTLPVVESKGENIVPILNHMKIDGIVGHWDFAYGPQHLKDLAKKLSFPVLAVNVYNKNGNHFFPPYVIKETNGLKVGVIGICANILSNMPDPFSHGLKVTDGIDELPEYIEKVKKEGADIVILLSHNGFPQDCELLKKVDGIDICLSAHTHNRLYEAVEINGTPVIQCGCHGSFIGHLEVELKEKKISSYRYELKKVSENFPIDTEVEKLVEDAIAPYKNYYQEIVGETPQILHRYNTLNATMDNLLLGAILNQSGAEVAFSNGWRYGIPIPKGKISKMDLYNMVPHNPKVSVVELTGEEIHTMLESNLESTFSKKPMHQKGGYVKRCLGISVRFRIENPKGHRIHELYIGKERYQKNKAYKAAFITEQAVPKKFGSNRKELEFTAVEAMQEFLKTNSLTKELINNKAFVTV